MGIYSPQSNTEFHGVLNKNVILPPFGWLDDIKYKIKLCVTPCNPWCKKLITQPHRLPTTS